MLYVLFIGLCFCWTRKGVYWMLTKSQLAATQTTCNKEVYLVFEELNIHPLEDNKAFVFHKHDSNTLKQFRLHHRHRCHENSNLIFMVFLFWIVFPFLLHHLLHHIHNTYCTRYCQNNRWLIVYTVLKTSHSVTSVQSLINTVLPNTYWLLAWITC